MISIIIPALNEENYLPFLLESVKKQNFREMEVIVADAGSKDRTPDIARKNKCLLVKGGSPAQGKNSGAKIAKGDLLLFLDADVVLTENFLENSVKEFGARRLDIAGFRVVSLKKGIGMVLFNIFYNFPVLALERILPHAAVGIMVKKDIFEKAGGFDPSIKLAEDHYFARIAAKIGRFGIIKSAKIFTSDRRFRKDGWVLTYFKYVLCELHMIFLGSVKSDFLKYGYDLTDKEDIR